MPCYIQEYDSDDDLCYYNNRLRRSMNPASQSFRPSHNSTLLNGNMSGCSNRSLAVPMNTTRPRSVGSLDDRSMMSGCGGRMGNRSMNHSASDLRNGYPSAGPMKPLNAPQQRDLMMPYVGESRRRQGQYSYERVQVTYYSSSSSKSSGGGCGCR